MRVIYKESLKLWYSQNDISAGLLAALCLVQLGKAKEAYNFFQVFFKYIPVNPDDILSLAIYSGYAYLLFLMGDYKGSFDIAKPFEKSFHKLSVTNMPSIIYGYILFEPEKVPEILKKFDTSQHQHFFIPMLFYFVNKNEKDMSKQILNYSNNIKESWGEEPLNLSNLPSFMKKIKDYSLHEIKNSLTEQEEIYFSKINDILTEALSEKIKPKYIESSKFRAAALSVLDDYSEAFHELAK